MTSGPDEGQHLRDLARLRRVRDRIDRTNRTDREFAQPLAEVVQEPTDQPWGSRDCAIRDLAGNMVRIQELG